MMWRLNCLPLKELRIFQTLSSAGGNSTIIYDTKGFHDAKSHNVSKASWMQNSLSSHYKGTKRKLIFPQKCINHIESVGTFSSCYPAVEINVSVYSEPINTSHYHRRFISSNERNSKNAQPIIQMMKTQTFMKTDQILGIARLSTEKIDESELENEVHYDRNFITAIRAMKEFLLKPEHLEGMRVTIRRSAKDNDLPLNVYWRKDVEAKSLAVWGSMDALEKEKEKREKQSLDQKEFVAFYKRYFTKTEERKKLSRKSWPIRALRPTTQRDGLKSESGRVVLWAIGINSGNTMLKFVAWLVTGSHAMFSEFIHSVADTLNQIILAYGIKSSAKKADENHPYGYTNMQYVSALISGVGIFCLGSGLSIYHGIDGLISPHGIGSMTVAFTILGISFISESVTLALAIKSIRESARFENMGFVEYVLRGYDPCVNVVLLEDTAAVLGVVIAAGSMGLSLHYGSHVPDALGSIAIGGLLGVVATFMITTNSNLLVGMYVRKRHAFYFLRGFLFP